MTIERIIRKLIRNGHPSGLIKWEGSPKWLRDLGASSWNLSNALYSKPFQKTVMD